MTRANNDEDLESPVWPHFDVPVFPILMVFRFHLEMLCVLIYKLPEHEIQDSKAASTECAVDKKKIRMKECADNKVRHSDFA